MDEHVTGHPIRLALPQLVLDSCLKKKGLGPEKFWHSPRRLNLNKDDIDSFSSQEPSSFNIVSIVCFVTFAFS